MNKFLTDTFSQVIYYGLLVALVFATFTGQDNILSVAAAAFWVVIALVIVLGPLTLILAYGAELVGNEKSGHEVLEAVKRITRRKNVNARWWGACCLPSSCWPIVDGYSPQCATRCHRCSFASACRWLAIR